MPLLLRLLFASLLCLPFIAPAQVSDAASSSVRVVDARRYHLGVAGLPEWEEFATSTPHGRQLDLAFTQETSNTESATLLIRQRNVKANWAVTLNGQRIGSLETLHQPLVRALAVPAGALVAGENKLTLARLPSPMLDDIEVGEIALDSRTRNALLSAATLEVEVSEDRMHVPCRITVVDDTGALVPLSAQQTSPALAVRTGVVYTGDGKARLGLRAGHYTIYASRGFEYSVATAKVNLATGETHSLNLEIKREVPTPGLLAADTHIHTLTYSKHGDATIDERMLTIAGEGIELAVATDHNHHADFSAPAERTGVNRHFRSVVGNEVTTKAGHFNAFPVSADATLPDHTLTAWPHLLQHIRRVTGAQVITLNHPRDLHGTFTPFGPDNFDSATGDLRLATPDEFDCDAIEVVTSAALQSDPLLLFRDWFALLNRGYRVAAIGASDTHDVSQFILGQARTYVVAPEPTDPSLASLDLEKVWASYKAGRLLVSFGLLTTLTLNERHHVGDLVRTPAAPLEARVEVFGPSWVTADRVELFLNGVRVAQRELTPTKDPTKARITFSIPRPERDAYLVAIATGPGVTAPFWETPPPYQAAAKRFEPRLIGATNPIWLDVDGDGRFTAPGARSK